MDCGTRSSPSNQALDSIGSSLAGSFAAAADRNPAVMESSLEQYREAKYVYDRQVDVHGHWIGLAMLLIVLGIGFDRVNFPGAFQAVPRAGPLGGGGGFFSAGSAAADDQSRPFAASDSHYGISFCDCWPARGGDWCYGARFFPCKCGLISSIFAF